MQAKKILVAPLDWGLGHATRCIPIVHYLLSLGHQVTWATEGAVAVLLKENFPDLTIIPLKGYRISYQKLGGSFAQTIVRQLPKVFKAICSERKWMHELLKQHRFDLIISDNRYGLHHPHIPSVILTHQVQMLSGKGGVLDKCLLGLHRKKLEKFQKCWIVDIPQAPGLAGILSHPDRLPNNAQYIGLLSQMQAQKTAQLASKPILLLLSGPEPQRTLLQSALLKAANDLPEYRFVLVAGKPDVPTPSALPAHITFITHAGAEQLAGLMYSAEAVVCRSGYSTLMDLVCMKKKALLIPTPGQTEQEYLARTLSLYRGFVCSEQDDIRLGQQLERLRQHSWDFPLRFNQTLMEQTVNEFMGI